MAVGDGVFGVPPAAELCKRIDRLTEQLHKAHKRYHTLRGLVDFYQAVGAEDARVAVLSYRAALQKIVELDDDKSPNPAAKMVGVARNAISDMVPACDAWKTLHG